jgi:hypothetical protein
MLTSLFPAYMKVTRSILKDPSFPVFFPVHFRNWCPAKYVSPGSHFSLHRFRESSSCYFFSLPCPSHWSLYSSVSVPMFPTSGLIFSLPKPKFLTSGPEFLTSGPSFSVFHFRGRIYVSLQGPLSCFWVPYFLTSESYASFSHFWLLGF